MALSQKLITITALVFLAWMTVGIIVYKSTANQLPDDYSQNVDYLKFSKSPETQLQACKTQGQKLSSQFWKRLNFRKEKIPQLIKDKTSMIVVESDFIMVDENKVHFLYSKPIEASNTSISILLLHGQSYNSETWNKLGTLRNLAAFGYYTIAIDLPGYGRSTAAKDLDRGEFVFELVTSLNLKNPVIVSPSMSGAFSLKYLLKHSGDMAGFIPVSPVSMSIIDESPCNSDDDDEDLLFDTDCQRVMHYLKHKPNLGCIKVPSLIVWGERDRGSNSAKLCHLPNGQGAEIPEGKHSAYLNNPDLWHKLLYNFLKVVDETLSCR